MFITIISITIALTIIFILIIVCTTILKKIIKKNYPHSNAGLIQKDMPESHSQYNSS